MEQCGHKYIRVHIHMHENSQLRCVRGPRCCSVSGWDLKQAAAQETFLEAEVLWHEVEDSGKDGRLDPKLSTGLEVMQILEQYLTKFKFTQDCL